MVLRERTRRGWGQVELTKKVNEFLPVGMTMLRQFLVKLEAGHLSRPIHIERRKAFCKALDINENEIPTEDDNLPGVIHTGEIKSHDCLPLLKRLVATNLSNLTFEQIVSLCETDYKLQKVGIKISFSAESIPVHQQ